MLHTSNRTVITAPFTDIFSLASAIEAWPGLLRHYRYVRVLTPASPGDYLQRRIVDMSARRSGIPVRWSSVQEIDAASREIRYHHVGGATRDMDVVWRFREVDGGVEVTIVHDLRPTRWWLWLPGVQYVMGTVFVHHIADQTLLGVKRAAECVTIGATM